MENGRTAASSVGRAPMAGSPPLAGRRRPACARVLRGSARSLCGSATACCVLLGGLAGAAGCRSSLTARRDAGRPLDDGAADLAATPPTDMAPDLPLARDLLAPDQTDVARVPERFRLVNHTKGVAYVQMHDPVACRRDTPSGWEVCSFFRSGCLFACDSIPASGDCCVYCERPLPALFAIPPGESQAVPWDGRMRTTRTGPCTECQCRQEMAIESASFEASARVFADYQCSPLPCETGPDGVITHAEPRGEAIDVTTLFGVPCPGDEVILDIVALPASDGGTGEDLAAVDLAVAPDHPADAVLPGFPEIPGRTFAIAADATPPDAMAAFGSACRPSDRSARYELRFSADGRSVSIVRTDPVQEQVLTGTLSQQVDSRLVYEIDNAFAGGELVVWRDNGALIGRLSLFGSGVPVIWCIEAPMTPR